MTIAIARRPPLEAATKLLRDAHLPTIDITEELLDNFFFAGSADAPLGIVGLEVERPYALLRSLVVDTSSRSSGLGSELLAQAERHAQASGVQTLYLLTTTAESFFAKRGYSRAPRTEAPPFINSSAEFASLCPASAAFMLKQL
jgi:amino-acid N-acetyltransferase